MADKYPKIITIDGTDHRVTSEEHEKQTRQKFSWKTRKKIPDSTNGDESIDSQEVELDLETDPSQNNQQLVTDDKLKIVNDVIVPDVGIEEPKVLTERNIKDLEKLNLDDDDDDDSDSEDLIVKDETFDEKDDSWDKKSMLPKYDRPGYIAETQTNIDNFVVPTEEEKNSFKEKSLEFQTQDEKATEGGNIVNWFNNESSYSNSDVKLKIAETADGKYKMTNLVTVTIPGEEFLSKEGEPKKITFDINNPFVYDDIQAHIKENLNPSQKEENLKYLSEFIGGADYMLHWGDGEKGNKLDDKDQFNTNMSILKGLYQNIEQDVTIDGSPTPISDQLLPPSDDKVLTGYVPNILSSDPQDSFLAPVTIDHNAHITSEQIQKYYATPGSTLRSTLDFNRGNKSEDGFVVLPSGDKVSYEYIFNNREEILAYKEPNSRKENKDKKKNEAFEQYLDNTEVNWEAVKNGEVSIDGINFKDHGPDAYKEEVLYLNHTEGGQMDVYLGLQPGGEENIEIAQIRDRLEDFKTNYTGDEPIDQVPEYKDLTERLSKTINELGFSDTELYDENFNFIHPNTDGEWDRKEGVGAGDQEEALLLSTTNDLHDLKSSLNNEIIEIVELIKMMEIDNARIWDTDRSVPRSSNFRRGVALLARQDDNWIHDLSQFRKVARTGKITGIGGDSEEGHMGDLFGVKYQDLPHLTKIDLGINDTEIAKKYNQTLDNIATYYQAIRLNINPVKLPVQGYWNETWSSAGEKFFGRTPTSTEKIKEDMGQWFENEGFEFDDSEFGESASRKAWDRVTGGVLDITQLTAGIAFGNKVTGVGKLFKMFNKFRTTSKLYKNSSKLKKTLNNMSFGALQTTTQFAVGENAWTIATGNDINQTIYFDKNGELVFHPTIAIGLGMGMPMWKAIQNAVVKNVATKMPRVYNFKPFQSALFGEASGVVGSGLSAATVISATEGITRAVTGEEKPESISGSYKQDFLESWLTFSAFHLLKRGPMKFVEAGRKDILNMVDPKRYQTEHLKTINMEKKKVDSEIEELNKKIEETEQREDLSIEEKGYQKSKLEIEKLKLKQKKADGDGIVDSDAIDKQTAIETKKVDSEILQVRKDLFKATKNQNKSEIKKGLKKLKELQLKKSNIKNANKMLHSYNLEYEAKAIAIAQNKYSKYLRDKFITKDNLFNELKMDPENLTAEQLELIGDSNKGLTPNALNILYEKLGIKEGSIQQKYYDYFVNNIRESVHKLNYFKIPKEAKERKDFIKDKLKQSDIENKISVLKDLIEKNPETKKENEIKIKKLEEQSKELIEGMVTRMETFNSNFKAALKRENKYLKTIVETSVSEGGLGGSYEALNTKEFKKKVEEHDGEWSADMDAFISKDGTKIFVDKQKALDVKDLTFGHHELPHMILYNLLKTTNAKGEKVVSKQGIETIDYMLDKLPGGRYGEAFKMLQERIDLNYRYEIDIEASKKASTTEPTIIYKKDANGKRIEKKKETYYEEYITVLGQLIKRGKIKPTTSLGRGIGKALYPWLKNVGPFKNMYKFKFVDKIGGEQAGKDLLKFVEWMGTKGFTENVLEVSKGQGIIKGKPTISESKSRDINNQVPKLKKGSGPIVERNTAIHDMLVKRAQEKFGDSWKKILDSDIKEYKTEKKEFIEETSDLRNAIAENNKNVAHWMAAHPKYGGKGGYSGIEGDILIGKDKFFEKFEDQLRELSRTYNPAKSNSPGAYLFETIKFRYPKIMDQLAPEARTKSITTEDGKVFDIEDVDANIYERFETENIIEIELKKREQAKIQETTEKQILRSKLRNEIGIEDIHKSEIFRKVEIDLRLAKVPIEKGFSQSLTKVTENTHFDILSKTLPIEKMLQYKNVILESIPISRLVQMGKHLPQGNIFVKEHTHPTKTKWGAEANIMEFMGIRPDGGFTVNKTGKNLLPEMKKLWDTFSKMPQAKQKASPEYIEYKKKLKVGFPKIYERLEVGPNEWKIYLEAATKGKRQVAAKSGTKGNNRDNILRKLSTSMTTDAMPELLSDKAVVDRYMDSKNLKGQIEAKALVDKFLNNIDKSQGLQFAKTVDIKFEKGKKREREISSGEKSIRGMYDVINKIAEVGVQNVYDFSPIGKKFEYKLKKEFEDLISDSEAKFVFENLILENKIFNHEGNVQVEKILEGIDPGLKRHLGFEQFIINQFKGVKGLVLKTEVQTEKGDMADVSAEIAGKAFNVEVKMSKARLGSLTGGIDIKNKKVGEITTKDFDKFRDKTQIESLLKESLKGWTEINKYYKKLSKFDGISNRDKILLKNFNKNNSAVPEWAFDAALEAGLYNKARSKGIFTETLIEDLYKHKTNPSEHMLWLGRGLLHLGRNTIGLETTKLEGEFFGEWGHSKSSITSTTTKHNAFITKENPRGVIDANGLITTSLRFIPTAKNITSKNSKINVTSKQGLEAFNNSVSKAKKVIEASNNVRKQITASRSIKNTIDLINGKKKKQGGSVYDFDDTVARTKSGVRYKQSNPSGEPAPSRKVIFLAGSAGSGKSNVIKQLGLEKQGFKIVNQDISLEWLAKNSGLPANMKDFTSEQTSKWGELQWEARDIAQRKQMKFQGKGEGIVVDGTGASKISMGTQVMKFRNAGYDVQMLFVETSLDVALERNRLRPERSLRDFIVERNWKAVQANKKAFKEDFKENFAEVNTDKLKQGDPMPKDLVSKLDAFTKGYIKGRLTAEEFANKGDKLLEQGAEFDFSEFSKVVDGKPGPYLEKLRERVDKYGNKDVFILTARPQASAGPIKEFLKSQGIDIPLKNITGLANSSGNAKAQWMLERYAEGYNDLYFVDDALQNVKAVKKALEQLDIKSKVVQAKIQFSKNINKSFNEMLERKSKIPARKKISLAEAKMIGKGKGRFDYFVPPSAEDLKGLIYKFLGKGRQGDADMKFFKEALFDPFAKGIRDHTIVKQKMSEEYKALKKGTKGFKLNQKIEGTPYNIDAAMRVYLWNKAGFEIPGIDKIEKRKLLDHIDSNPNLISFAETLGSISRIKEGYSKPSEYWMVESIASDLNQIVRGQTRKDFLAEWIQNKDILFSPENMNKIEATEGKWHREALEHMLYRMETGTNRLVGIKDGVTKEFYDWINGAVGATMFWNTRSAVLQTISTINFTNMADNNPFAQAKAFANQKQFWKDFSFIFNSPMLKQRRAGLEIDVSASELTTIFEKSGKSPKAILRYMLEKGFTPTRIADSFAIALGGAGFYRNRLKKYLKEGMSKVEAKKQTWLDFQEIAEETQQSSRPDLISQQQAGPLGRIILAWQNTPMQMTRLMKKKLSNLVNRRRNPGQTQTRSDISNLSGILYYGALQNLWFGALQSGLAWMMFGSDMEDKFEEKEGQVINGAFDTLLRGTGVYGAAFSTLKNTVLRYIKEEEKGWKGDHGNTIVEAINLSPPIGSKVRKVYSAIKTWDYNDIFGDVSKEVGFDPSNPDLSAIANIIEAATNIPLARIVNKANNMEEAITGNHETWQRIAMTMGWNRWNVGVKDEELEAARETVKEEKKEDKEQKKKEDKEQKKKEEEIEKKKKGIKTVQCSGISSSGKRCGNTTETADKTWKCYSHMDFTDGMDRDGDGIKEYRCTATKTDGNRCKNKTENKSKKCYAHQ